MKRPTTPEDAAQQRILDIIVGQDDVSWKGIIFGLIDSHQMDPWDINISLIAERFIQELRKLQQMDFRIGGKVVLASAILLKLKAERLYDDELGALDSLIQAVNTPDDLGLADDGLGIDGPRQREPYPKLTPRTPQPRKRKVSVYDLIEALEQALDAEANRPVRIVPRTLDTIDPPDHHIDISKVIQEVYRAIYDHYEARKQPTGSLAFSHLVKGESKRDHVLAFIPLLHLETARKVDLDQQAHFGPITVHLIDPTPPVFEQPKTEDRIRPVRKARKEAPKKEAPAEQEGSKKASKGKQASVAQTPIVELQDQEDLVIKKTKSAPKAPVKKETPAAAVSHPTQHTVPKRSAAKKKHITMSAPTTKEISTTKAPIKKAAVIDKPAAKPKMIVPVKKAQPTITPKRSVAKPKAIPVRKAKPAVKVKKKR